MDPLLELLIRLAERVDPTVDQDRLLAPMYELCTALMSLDHGVAVPPLQRRKLNHRPPDLRHALFRGYVAAASEILIRSGTSGTAADAIVAKRLAKAGWKGISAVTVKGWRKAVREAAPGDLMRGIFDNWLNDEAGLREILPYVAAAHTEIPIGNENQQNGALKHLATIELLLAGLSGADWQKIAPEK